jgi:hypothetical protein
MHVINMTPVLAQEYEKQGLHNQSLSEDLVKKLNVIVGGSDKSSGGSDKSSGGSDKSSGGSDKSSGGEESDQSDDEGDLEDNVVGRAPRSPEDIALLEKCLFLDNPITCQDKRIVQVTEKFSDIFNKLYEKKLVGELRSLEECDKFLKEWLPPKGEDRITISNAIAWGEHFGYEKTKADRGWCNPRSEKTLQHCLESESGYPGSGSAYVLEDYIKINVGMSRLPEKDEDYVFSKAFGHTQVPSQTLMKSTQLLFRMFCTLGDDHLSKETTKGSDQLAPSLRRLGLAYGRLSDLGNAGYVLVPQVAEWLFITMTMGKEEEDDIVFTNPYSRAEELLRLLDKKASSLNEEDANLFREVFPWEHPLHSIDHKVKGITEDFLSFYKYYEDLGLVDPLISEEKAFEELDTFGKSPSGHMLYKENCFFDPNSGTPLAEQGQCGKNEHNWNVRKPLTEVMQTVLKDPKGKVPGELKKETLIQFRIFMSLGKNYFKEEMLKTVSYAESIALANQSFIGKSYHDLSYEEIIDAPKVRGRNRPTDSMYDLAQYDVISASQYDGSYGFLINRNSHFLTFVYAEHLGIIRPQSIVLDSGHGKGAKLLWHTDNYLEFTTYSPERTAEMLSFFAKE